MMKRKFALSAAGAAFGVVLSSSAATTWPVTTADELTNAVTQAAAGDTIKLAAGTYDLTGKYMKLETYLAGSTTVNSYSHLNVDKQLTFLGDETGHWAEGEGAVVLTGDMRGAYVSNDSTVFRGITFRDFKACDRPDLTPASGGNLARLSLGGGVNGNCTVTNCVFDGCNARSGGAVYGNTCQDCKFVSCTAIYNGGAGEEGKFYGCHFEYNSASSAGVLWWPNACEDCTFANNQSTSGDGGAVLSTGNNMVFRRCAFWNNSSKSGGGALQLRPKSVIEDCVFSNNTAATSGGAIIGPTYDGGANGGKDAIIRRCSFVGNSALDGGGFYDGQRSWDDGDNAKRRADAVMVYDCVFTNNSASRYGGALYAGAASNCTFYGNSAAALGGAIYSIANHSNHVAIACHFVSNAVTTTTAVDGAGYGGAIYDPTGGANPVASFRAYGCTFEGNSAILGGGAMLTGIASNCVFVGNSVSGTSAQGVKGGGAVMGSGSTVRQIGYADCTFVGNFCSGDGKGGAGYDGATGPNSHNHFDRCAFTNNYTFTGGGALYGGVVSNCTFFGNHSNGSGGAILGCGQSGNYVIYGSSFTSNSVERTSVDSYGSAIYVCNDPNAPITKCSFDGNTYVTKNDKGGSVVYGNKNSLTDCAFTNNYSRYGGIVRSCNCTRTVFSGNEHVYGTYGVISYGSATDCTFVGNRRRDTFYEYTPRTEGTDGAQCANIAGGDAISSTLTRCDLDGGIIYHCILNDCRIHDCTNNGTYCAFYGLNIATNCLVTRVRQGNSGWGDFNTKFRGLIYRWGSNQTETWDGHPRGEFVNCTFADCTYPAYWSLYTFFFSQPSTPTPHLFENCLFYNNYGTNGSLVDFSIYTQAEVGADIGVEVKNCVSGVTPWMNNSGKGSWTDLGGNKVIAPDALGILKGEKAAEKGVADYTLRYGSPARGLGDASIWDETATDLAGNLRKRNGKVDPGCYECWIEPVGMLIFLR